MKGRIYALDAKTGKIVWEFYLDRGRLDARTARHDAACHVDMENTSGTPITGGATWTSYALDPATGFYMSPAAIPHPTSRPARATARISIPARSWCWTPRPGLTRSCHQYSALPRAGDPDTNKTDHFCPGTVGAAEWNGPGYVSQTNLTLSARSTGAPQ